MAASIRTRPPVFLFGVNSTDNLVQGNFIGTDAIGTSALGNINFGVFIALNASGNTIGGRTNDAGNTIAFNGLGVFVFSGTRNSIVSNSIFSNSGGANSDFGIDLAPVGLNANDPGDSDTGANNLQNFPVIASLEVDASGDLVVEYVVDSSPAFSTYPLRVEFFEADADGEEGQRCCWAAPCT